MQLFVLTNSGKYVQHYLFFQWLPTQPITLQAGARLTVIFPQYVCSIIQTWRQRQKAMHRHEQCQVLNCPLSCKKSLLFVFNVMAFFVLHPCCSFPECVSMSRIACQNKLSGYILSAVLLGCELAGLVVANSE